MRYLLTGGGSGGHIFPLLSFVTIIKQYDQDAEFLFVGNKDKMEAEIVPKHNVAFKSVLSTGTKGKISWQNIKALGYMAIGYIQAKKIIDEFQPDVCIGAGGYVSVPVMYAAIRKKNIVTVIIEHDQFIGRANYQLSKKVDLIFSAMFSLRQRYFLKNNNYYHVGHARSHEIYLKYKDEIEQKAKKNTIENILFIGGSLGAEAINEAAILVAKTFPQLNIYLISGKRYYKKMLSEKEQFPNLILYDFVDELHNLYQKSDIIVSRASAGVLAEIATYGIIPILIPSPHVMNNHQYYNAKYIVDKRAGFMIEEAQENRELLAVIDGIQQKINEKKEMEKNLKTLALVGDNQTAKIFQILHDKILEREAKK